jgi:hypothetical protein
VLKYDIFRGFWAFIPGAFNSWKSPSGLCLNTWSCIFYFTLVSPFFYDYAMFFHHWDLEQFQVKIFLEQESILEH